LNGRLGVQTFRQEGPKSQEQNQKRKLAHRPQKYGVSERTHGTKG
jgi:hypothetical protein